MDAYVCCCWDTGWDVVKRLKSRRPVSKICSNPPQCAQKPFAAFEYAEGLFSGGEKHLRSAHCDVSVRPDAQCLHRCTDNSECPDKNRLPGDASPAGARCPGPRIGQQSHSSSYHALRSLFPKTSATSWLNPTCSRPLGRH